MLWTFLCGNDVLICGCNCVAAIKSWRGMLEAMDRRGNTETKNFDTFCYDLYFMELVFCTIFCAYTGGDNQNEVNLKFSIIKKTVATHLLACYWKLGLGKCSWYKSWLFTGLIVCFIFALRVLTLLISCRICTPMYTIWYALMIFTDTIIEYLRPIWNFLHLSKAKARYATWIRI